jgi:hypothetical protein
MSRERKNFRMKTTLVGFLQVQAGDLIARNEEGVA